MLLFHQPWSVSMKESTSGELLVTENPGVPVSYLWRSEKKLYFYDFL